MLVIRLQRTGRRGHAMFRVVVQDSRRTPTSGRVIAWLGHYDPHTKDFKVDQEKAAFYLEHGAQPSPKTAVLLQASGAKLPKWVTIKASKTRSVRNPEKRRSTRPAEPEPAAANEAEPAPVEPSSDTEATAKE